jgi:hypothetical protein
MENVYTEESMVLLEGMDHLMASHADVKRDVNVQAKQEEMEDVMSVRNMTPRPPLRASISYSTLSHPTPSPILPANTPKMTFPRHASRARQDSTNAFLLRPVSPMAPPPVPARASSGPNQADLEVAFPQLDTKPSVSACVPLQHDAGDMILVPRAELQALEREIIIRSAE